MAPNSWHRSRGAHFRDPEAPGQDDGGIKTEQGAELQAKRAGGNKMELQGALFNKVSGSTLELEGEGRSAGVDASLDSNGAPEAQVVDERLLIFGGANGGHHRLRGE